MVSGSSSRREAAWHPGEASFGCDIEVDVSVAGICVIFALSSFSLFLTRTLCSLYSFKVY